MKIAQRDSAIDAYHEGHKSMEDRVYRFLVSRGQCGGTILEIARAVEREIGHVVESNQITGRLHDLRDEKRGVRGYRIVVAPWRRECEINRRNKMVWLAVATVKQMGLFGRVA